MLFIKSRSKLWFSSQLKLNNLKFRSSLFKGLRVLKIFRYNNLSGTNSVAVCVLRLSLFKQETVIVIRNAKTIVNAMRLI